MFVVVSYDVTNNKRRSKICNELKNYGEHVQYSIFDCEISRVQLIKLQSDLNRIINKRQDGVRYYFLCQKCVDKINVQGKKSTEFF